MSFHNFMQNSAVKAPNPFVEVPDLTPKVEEPAEAVELVLSGESFEFIDQATTDFGKANPAELITDSLHIALPIMEAIQKGFTRLLLVNDDTEKVVTIQLSDDTESD